MTRTGTGTRTMTMTGCNFIKVDNKLYVAFFGMTIKHPVKPLKDKLEKGGFNFDIYGRPKSIHSIWNKMRKKGVAFEEIDVDARPEARTEMTTRSGRRTVPQIFIGDSHVGGCDDLFELDRSGELDRLIQRAC